MECYRHNKVETLLRCGKCERPICGDCTVYGPAGARCRECSSLNSSPLFQVDHNKLAAGSGICIGVSTAIGLGLAYLSMFGFLLIWGGIVGGGFIGECLLRATGRKRGRTMEITAGICSTIGMILGLCLWRVLNGFPIDLPELILHFRYHPFYALSILVTIGGAISRIRFM